MVPVHSTDAEPLFSDISNEEARAANIAALAASGLFDAEYYVTSYPDLASLEIDPLVHFYDYGFAEGRRPNPYFDANWYLDRNLDVATAGVHPLLHYVGYGDAEGRSPSILFNPTWYRKNYEVSNEENALAHYLRNCRSGAFSPIPEFDIHHYARNYPDVIAAGIDPFQHYITYGFSEGRSPSEEFDGRWYASRYMDGNRTVITPLSTGYIIAPHLAYMPACQHMRQVSREVKRFSRPSACFEEVAPLPKSAPRRAKILAMYLPQFHAFPENDKWWGRGFTEWTNLARGIPRFKGHYQPRIPRDLGFYELGARKALDTLGRQVALARGAGIHGFIYYYYTFNGKRLMEYPVDEFLRSPKIDFPFALMWANENWTRRWDGAESEILISQDYRQENDEDMIRDFVRHFKDPRYIRLKGRPLLMVYRPGIIPDAKASIARWRELFSRKYKEQPIIFMAQGFGDTDPTKYGLDGAVEFPPHKLTQDMQPINEELDYLDAEFSGKVYSYDAIVDKSLSEPLPTFPLIKTAVPSWDNDARRQGQGLVIKDSSPDKYQEWLSALVDRARSAPLFDEALVCINAWNEWCEGAYLEPDIHFGAAYLNATGRAVSGIPQHNGRPYSLLLVGHDAFPSGAQQLLLKIGSLLRRRYGLPIEFLLMGGGELVESYAKIGPTTVTSAGTDIEDTLQAFASKGIRRALLNTSATGSATVALEKCGIIPETLLVHEMPGLIKQKVLTESVRQGFRLARNVIFPGRTVQTSVTNAIGEAVSGNTFVVAQGSYKHLSVSDKEIKSFRGTLGISTKDKLVLGVGYADMRKGFDLFLQVWRLMNAKQKVHFCWVGAIAPELDVWLKPELNAATATGLFHLTGNMDNVAPAYGSAAALLLTSREDPFPTVVLEALALGKPVIAFAEAGGIPELLRESDCGLVVPYADTVAMGLALEEVFASTEDLSVTERRRTLIRDRFNFENYVDKLLTITLPEMPRISVAVPNYNYARFMPERLGSIFRQTHPLHEVIVLDDASTDRSIEVIPQIADEWGREVQLVTNKANSGSVFAQWHRAAETATGEWLWIAEADDSCDPGFVAQLMVTCLSDKNIAMAFCDSRTISAGGAPQWNSYKDYYATAGRDSLTQTEVFDGADFASRFMSVRNLILNVSSVIWRRTALLAALKSLKATLNGYKLAGDWRLYLEVLAMRGARIAYDATALNVHRRHSQSVTHALNIKRHIAEIELCHKAFLDKFGKNDRSLKVAQKSYVDETDLQLRETRSK